MRLIEIISFVLILIWLLANYFQNFKNCLWKKTLPFLAIILNTINFLFNKNRWQMVPISIFIIILIAIELIPNKNKIIIKNNFLRIVGMILTFVLFAITLSFPLLLPVLDLPKPHGPYDIGTVSIRMTDSTRKEIYTSEPNDDRNILVKVWYPTDNKESNKPVTYWDKEGLTGKAYSLNADMGTFWYKHLSDIKTNSFAEAPIANKEKNYPIIIYSHSFVGLNTENTILFEELASQGYVVFSIGHTYETIISIFPDGEVVPENYNYIFELYDSNFEQEEQLYQLFYNSKNIAEKQAIIKQILTIDDSSTAMIKTRTKDVIFVLDELEKLNQNGSLFDSKLDLTQVGVMGWSFGGATAIDACIIDTRCKAGINIDGWPYGENFSSNIILSQPFMVINAADGDESDNIVGELAYQRSEDDAFRIIIDDTSHTNFWDFPFFFNIYKHLGYWGTIDSLRLVEIENAYISAFFDKYLKNENNIAIEEISNRFPEIEFYATFPQ